MALALGLVAACGTGDSPGEQAGGTTSDGPAPPIVPVAEPEPAPEPEAAPAPRKRARLTLRVAEPVLGRILPFGSGSDDEASIDEAFTRARALSGPLCRYKHGLEELDRRAVRAFVDPANLFVKAAMGDKWSLISGCWNFVRMNDRRTYRDFELLRALYPGDGGYACQAVGVMQPYIMSELLGCRSITMLDFDWQIQAIHWQLVRAWREGGLADDRLEDTLSGVRVDWVAHHKPREGHKVDMGTFCHPSMTDRCRETFVAFDGRREDPALERITLHLGGLHTLDVDRPDPGAPLPVIFLSNATEKHFLTHAEFQDLLTRVTEGLAVGTRAVLVHHVAADWAFGIYELERTSEGNDLRARCRDEYVRNKATSHPEPYETWFESELQRRAGGRRPVVPPTCQELLKQARRQG